MKLVDLPYGYCNPVKDDGVDGSTDRRRSNGVDYLTAVIQDVYSRKATAKIGVFTGVVLYAADIDEICSQDRGKVLEQLATKTTAEMAVSKLIDFFRGEKARTVPVYKVYIPELECRPAPMNFADPIIHTYYNVYLDARMEGESLSVGQVCEVRFDNLNNFSGARIIAAGPEIQWQESSDSSLAGTHTEGIPTPAGNTDYDYSSGGGGSASPFAGTVPRPGPEDPYITRMSEAAREKKRKAEGTVLSLYNDPYNLCTIGKGHLIGHKSCKALHAEGKIPEKWLAGGLPEDGKNKRAPNPTMTEAQAEALFIEDIEKREKILVNMLKKANNVKVTQNQFDALMSAVYNAGQGSVNKFIIKPYLANNDFQGAANAFTVYNQMGYRRSDHPKYLAGLNRLREREKNQFGRG